MANRRQKKAPRRRSSRGRRSAGRARPAQSLTISACFIAKNEQECIARAIESVRPEVDELIVVDTGSSDGTASIARSHGAKVSRFAWCDDFAAARNASLAQAACDWILILDCDEQLAVEAPGALKKALVGQSADTAVVRMTDVRGGRPGGAVWNAVRLLRNQPEVRFAGRVHERLRLPPGCRQAPLDGAAPGFYIAHHGYDLSAEAERGKIARNRRLIDLALADVGGADAAQRNLLLFYRAFGAGSAERGVLLEDWIADVDRRPALLQAPVCNWVAAGLAQYASCLLERGRAPEAKFRAQQALECFGPHPAVGLVLAREAALAGRYGDAEAHLREVTSARPRTSPAYAGFPFDAPMVCRRGMALLAEIRERFGDLDEARAIYCALLSSEPGYLPVALRLLCVLVQMGQYAEARRLLARYPALCEQGHSEIDCLGLALALIDGAPDVSQWVERVTPRIVHDPLADRVWRQAMSAPAHRGFELRDFPDLAHGVRSHLP